MSGQIAALEALNEALRAPTEPSLIWQNAETHACGRCQPTAFSVRMASAKKEFNRLRPVYQKYAKHLMDDRGWSIFAAVRSAKLRYATERRKEREEIEQAALILRRDRQQRRENFERMRAEVAERMERLASTQAPTVPASDLETARAGVGHPPLVPILSEFEVRPGGYEGSLAETARQQFDRTMDELLALTDPAAYQTAARNGEGEETYASGLDASGLDASGLEDQFIDQLTEDAEADDDDDEDFDFEL